MTDPTLHDTTPPDDAGAADLLQDPDEPAQLSLAAAFASLFAVLGLLGCLTGLPASFLGLSGGSIALLTAPVVAIFGAILGYLALRRMDRTSRARAEGITPDAPVIVGRPMALFGLFVGIGAGVISGAIVLAGLATLSANRALIPPTVDILIGAQNGSLATVRSQLGADADASLTDQQILDFGAQLRSRVGDVASVNASLDVVGASRQAVATSPDGTTAQIPIEAFPRPLWVEFTNGQRLLAYINPDADAVAQGIAKVADITLYFDDGSVLILRDNGPGRTVADELGWTVLTTP